MVMCLIFNSLESFIPFWDEELANVNNKNIMLTGGRGAERLYRNWMQVSKKIFKSVNRDFFFTDERCVPQSHPLSNYLLVKNTIFCDGISSNIRINRIEADSINLQRASDEYSRLLPDKIDILLLSIGEDGHIASLFPYGLGVAEQVRSVIPVESPSHQCGRITITPKVIKSASQVYVLALGDKKRQVYDRLSHDPENIEELPARLVLDKNWVFD